jgi:cell wall-associated NlpC family hydrolase
LQALLQYAHPVDPPYLAGDVVMAKLPGAASVGHAALCIGSDEIVHAYSRRRGVIREALRRSVVWRWKTGVYGVRGVVD